MADRPTLAELAAQAESATECPSCGCSDFRGEVRSKRRVFICRHCGRVVGAHTPKPLAKKKSQIVTVEEDWPDEEEDQPPD